MTIKKVRHAPTPKIITSVSMNIDVNKWFAETGLSLSKVVNALPAKLLELETLRATVKDMALGIKRKDDLIIKQAAQLERLHEMVDRMRAPK